MEHQNTEKNSSERDEDTDAHRIQTRGRYRGERRTRPTPRARHASTSRPGREEQPQQNTTRLRCSCCGKPNHHKRDCWHGNKSCDTCGKTGHSQAVCKASKAGKRKKNVKNVDAEDAESDTRMQEAMREARPIYFQER